jgi:class 3 adenylate cyclase
MQHDETRRAEEKRTEKLRMDKLRIEQMFKSEYDVVASASALLQRPDIDHDTLRLGFQNLLRDYNSLLHQVAKMTNIGDSTQRKLIKTQEELEALNGRLLELYQVVDDQRERADDLLLNILPAPIASRMKNGETVIADKFDDASVLFSDMVGFTAFASKVSATELVEMLNQVFSIFDSLVERGGLEKIKTIGDSYMAAGGLPEPHPTHLVDMVAMAIEMLRALRLLNDQQAEYFSAIHAKPFDIRIGIHAGEVVAGVIGKRRFVYDLWGETVNIASRMESHGVAGAIHVSQIVYERLKGRFPFEARGVVDVKGVGKMNTYLLRV